MARPHPHKRVARAAAFSILTFLTVMAVIWLAPRMSDAVAAWLKTPPVRSESISLSGSLPVVAQPAQSSQGARSSASGASLSAKWAGAVTIDAGLRFTMIGVAAQVPTQAGDVTVMLRTSEDGASWGRWYRAPLEVAAEGNDRRPTAYTEAMWTGPGRYVQVAALRSATGRAPHALRGVRVVAINSTEDADRGDALLGVVRRTGAAIAGLNLVPPARAMTTKPVIVTRAQWGANESYRSGSPSYGPVEMAFVHHAVSGNGYTPAQSAAIMRGIYAYHTKSLGWSDVGYNFLVDRYGTIYEGRYGGMTSGVIGAQVLGFNTGSTGISMIGTFSDVKPPDQAVVALENLLAWKLDVHHVNPQGTATLVCGYEEKFSLGAHVTFPAIAGHRQANFTECPGSKLYGLLPSVRAAVAATGQPKIYDFEADQTSISPNGDGVLDSMAASFTVSEDADWSVEVRLPSGGVVRRLTGRGTSAEVSWAGESDAGGTVADGAYKLVAAATSLSGTARTASAMVNVDTSPPSVVSATVAPDPFSPNGDGYADVTKLTFLPGETGSANVSVVGAADAVLRVLADWHAVTAAPQTVAWDGKISDGTNLVNAPEGKATLLISMRDLAGNTATVRKVVGLDRTLGFASVTPSECSPNGDGVLDAAVVAYKLTRRADITLTILSGDSVVRSIHAGSAVDKGSRAVAWDGKVSDGAYPASGVYVARLTAVAGTGTSIVSRSFTVDLFRPVLTVPSTAKSKRGSTAKLSYRVRDPYSSTVKVKVTVTKAGGIKVATLQCGWVKQGKGLTLAWRPPARGIYKLRFSAVDRAGNRQAAARVTTLTVR